ncbi:unnamed protein product [Amoebophrya sp. A120]|nr:unnamed protein product [Amoebophrya sp. A120]|eukprot:GSA120T00022916001.1
MAATVCGSPLYMAPEILQHQKYDSRADLWSVGAILFECFVGKTPFTGPNPMQLLANIEQANGPAFPESCRLSDNGKKFLSLLLEKDPAKRLPANAFMHHEYVAGDLDLKECKFSVKELSDGELYVGVEKADDEEGGSASKNGNDGQNSNITSGGIGNLSFVMVSQEQEKENFERGEEAAALQQHLAGTTPEKKLATAADPATTSTTEALGLKDKKKNEAPPAPSVHPEEIEELKSSTKIKHDDHTQSSRAPPVQPPLDEIRLPSPVKTKSGDVDLHGGSGTTSSNSTAEELKIFSPASRVVEPRGKPEPARELTGQGVVELNTSDQRTSSSSPKKPLIEEVSSTAQLRHGSTTPGMMEGVESRGPLQRPQEAVDLGTTAKVKPDPVQGSNTPSEPKIAVTDFQLEVPPALTTAPKNASRCNEEQATSTATPLTLPTSTPAAGVAPMAPPPSFPSFQDQRRVAEQFAFLAEKYAESHQPAESACCLVECCSLLEQLKERSQHSLASSAPNGNMLISPCSPRDSTSTNTTDLAKQKALQLFQKKYPNLESLSLQRHHPGKLLTKYALKASTDLCKNSNSGIVHYNASSRNNSKSGGGGGGGGYQQQMTGFSNNIKPGTEIMNKFQLAAKLESNLLLLKFVKHHYLVEHENYSEGGTAPGVGEINLAKCCTQLEQLILHTKAQI